ncbi:MAG: nuclear transport factor 2 family protein [Pseudomonadota bacterium]
MTGSQQGLDLLALQQLAARYWARADGDAGQSLSQLFTPDGALLLGSLTLNGIEAIERFFGERDVAQAAALRTTRHIACNHLATWFDDNRVQVRSTVLVYVGMGSLPLESTAPAGIADFEDICVRPASGGWRFERREGRTVFIGPGAAKFAR